MKKQIAVSLSIITLVMAVLGMSACNNQKEEESSASEKMYSIKYYGVVNGKIEELHPNLFYDDGSYPTGYDEGERIYISPLKSYAEISQNEDRMFSGWYADSTCTTLYSDIEKYEVEEWFDGTMTTEVKYSGITFEANEDIVLYAKLSAGYWIGPY